MKSLLLSITMLLMASSVFASINPNSSWEEIFAARGPYRIAAPTVYMGRSIDYTFVCKSGDMLRTKKPVDIVETRVGNHGPTKFVVVGHELLSTPIRYSLQQDQCDQTHERTVCTPHVVAGEYPLTVLVNVYKTTLKEQREYLWFKKPYTVPNCHDEEPMPN
ncbi:hypothetical protein [Bdellovibrio svalbardensis]|uniref:Uncharacterized protein n=1 Tax=Bdellovibrio svalbardensis TaxID=2972972 RepID=A0ABT6DES9_9BACT|nr:hypothetical protein [Bdellovibrio svalbardensis]MDG0815034.1 hypothetical protein [Bdellovibrio svalbardensis]